jgi:hypothetical protein
MSSLSALVARGSTLLARDSSSSSSPEMSSTVIDLLIALLVLVFILLLLTAAIFIMRRARNRRALARQQLPLYSEKPAMHQRQLTISSSRASSIYYPNEKSPRPAAADVPEIRITFPDDHDESGRPRSGRVLLVRVGDTSVGLEPLDDEQLPAYEKESSGRFHSIDMDRIGGLKESAPTYS